MTSKIALILALLLHVGFKILVFMDPPSRCCSLDLNVRSVLFLTSLVMFLSRTKIFPQRYRKVPLVAQAIAEFFFFLLAVEIGMIAIWCRIEAMLFKIFDCMFAEKQSMLYSDMGGDGLVSFVVTLVSVLTFVITANATGYVDYGSQLYNKAIKKLEDLIERVRKRREGEICQICCFPPPPAAGEEEAGGEHSGQSERTPRRSTRRTPSRDTSGYGSYLEVPPRATSSTRRSSSRRRRS